MTSQSLDAKITAALEVVKATYPSLSAAHERGFSPAELPGLENALAEFERNRLFELDDGRHIDLGDLLVLRDVASENHIELERLLKGGRVTLDDKGSIGELNLADLGLTTLNLSGLTALSTLDVSNNQLTSLDLSRLTALTKLYVCFNDLISLDLSQNRELTELNLAYNQLTSLDLSKNAALTELYLNFNPALSTLSLPASLTSLRGSAHRTYLPWKQLKELLALGMEQ